MIISPWGVISQIATMYVSVYKGKVRASRNNNVIIGHAIFDPLLANSNPILFPIIGYSTHTQARTWRCALLQPLPCTLSLLRVKPVSYNATLRDTWFSGHMAHYTVQKLTFPSSSMHIMAYLITRSKLWSFLWEKMHSSVNTNFWTVNYM